MPTDLICPLGYLAAKRAIEAGRSAFFRARCLDIPERTSAMLAGDDRIPQFGFVGANYHSLRVLLLGINPGNGPKKANFRSVADGHMMPALHSFFEVQSPQTFLDAQRAYENVCQSWAVWGRHCAELLADSGVMTDQIAYSNCFPWRTASESAFGKFTSERAAELYAIPLVEELKPRIIVAVGKKAAAILGYARITMPPIVVWNRAQALTKSVDDERRLAAAQFRALLEEQRNLNAT